MKTFLILPPRVTISALRGLSRRDLRVWIRSGIRSNRSSQQRDALITNLPSPEHSSSLDSRSVISSLSDGIPVSISMSSDASSFSSLTRSTTFASKEALSVWKKGSEAIKMGIDSLPASSLGFPVILGGGESSGFRRAVGNCFRQLRLIKPGAAEAFMIRGRRDFVGGRNAAIISS
nr:hypothetical protein Iba_chr14dCG11270 [Ipomoea batatas]